MEYFFTFAALASIFSMIALATLLLCNIEKFPIDELDERMRLAKE